MTGRPPEFDELIGEDVSPAERERLRRAHDLLLAAGPPPELSPELEAVQWPEEALAPLGLTRRAGGTRKRSPLLVAAALITVAAVAFLLGQATGGNSPNAIDAQRVVRMQGTSLDSNAAATLELGGPDLQGNWPMLLHVTGLQPLLPQRQLGRVHGGLPAKTHPVLHVEHRERFPTEAPAKVESPADPRSL